MKNWLDDVFEHASEEVYTWNYYDAASLAKDYTYEEWTESQVAALRRKADKLEEELKKKLYDKLKEDYNEK